MSFAKKAALLAAALAAGAAGADQGGFTVATWNIGHFSLGTSAISKLPAAEGGKWRDAYRGFVDSIGARIVFVEEYSPYIDTEKTIRTPQAVFGGYETALEGPSGGGGHVNSIFANGCECLDSGIYAYGHRYQNTNYRFMRTEIDGLETLLVATHLEPNWPNPHREMRAMQIRQLLEAVGSLLPCCERFLTADERVVWKNADIAKVSSISAAMTGRWISMPHVAKGVIYDRTPVSFKVQFQSLAGEWR